LYENHSKDFFGHLIRKIIKLDKKTFRGEIKNKRKNGNNWIITGLFSNSLYQRKIEVNITRTGKGITLNNWQEL